MRKIVRVALAAAESATGVHRTWAGRVGAADARDKSTSDFVSKVDMEAQEACVGRIRADFPDHPVLAEEEDGRPPPELDGPRDTPIWVVDPLDGTTNFLHGHPAWAASVGVVLEGRLVAGAVVSAATSDRWWAGEGEGAFRNGERIRVSQLQRLDRALVGTGFPFKRSDLLDPYLEQFRRVLPATSGIRRCGSAALDLCFLAQGLLDAFWELHLAPWDVAAGLCILEEAGGVWSRVDGDESDPLQAGSVLAANSPGMLQALGTLLREE